MGSISERPRPFLKWAGGKSQLLGQLTHLFPKKFNSYIEPFLGSGAVFFHMKNLGKASSALLADTNQELIDCYLGIRDHLGEVLHFLAHHKQYHSRDYYYEVRSSNPWIMDLPERAARLIYLNKTCFNGLYRVNKLGHFNVPIGSFKRPAILDEKKLQAASNALKITEIRAMDFLDLPSYVSPGDFVYFDPPYQPLNRTSNFTGYTKNAFTEASHIALADTAKRLHDQGAFVMISNSSTDFTRNLYDQYGFFVSEVLANRSINANAERRGMISELVITSYPVNGPSKAEGLV